MVLGFEQMQKQSKNKNMLKVKDLIKKLKKEDPNAIVVSTSDNYELQGEVVPISRVTAYKGEMIEKRFRDDFDGGSYNKEVVSLDDKKGKKKFIQIH